MINEYFKTSKDKIDSLNLKPWKLYQKLLLFIYHLYFFFLAVVGLKKIRITGGEPLLRKNIDKLIYKLKNEVGIKDVSMTTNGSLLTDKKLNELKASGLDSVTLSLDTLHFDKTVQINGTKKTFDLDKVLEGIEKYFN